MDQEGSPMSTQPTPSTATTAAAPPTPPTTPTTLPVRKQPILTARGLVKRFGVVVGLDGVDLDLYPGEVLAIIGDNGAGKSTLVKCLSGALTPDQGTIKLGGQVVRFRG